MYRHLSVALLLSAASFCSVTQAEEHEHRQHGAHVHGLGQLNIALEGDELEFEFSIPAMDIVGFEHPAHDEHDMALLHQAVAVLKAANCSSLNTARLLILR